MFGEPDTGLRQNGERDMINTCLRHCEFSAILICGPASVCGESDDFF
jgi:hypothetical protein